MYNELQIPVLDPSPLQSDLPGITYYTQASWEASVKSMGNDSAESALGRKWDFIQLRDGSPMPATQLKAMRALARDFFTTMSQHVAVMPSTWQAGFPIYWRYLFIKTLERGCEPLADCEGHWKTRKVGSVQLSSFKKTRKDLFEITDGMDSDGESPEDRVPSKSTTLGKRHAVDPIEQRYRKVVVIDDSDDEDAPRPKASGKRRVNTERRHTIDLQDSAEEEVVLQVPRPKSKPTATNPL